MCSPPRWARSPASSPLARSTYGCAGCTPTSWGRRPPTAAPRSRPRPSNRSRRRRPPKVTRAAPPASICVCRPTSRRAGMGDKGPAGRPGPTRRPHRDGPGRTYPAQQRDRADRRCRRQQRPRPPTSRPEQSIPTVHSPCPAQVPTGHMGHGVSSTADRKTTTRAVCAAGGMRMLSRILPQGARNLRSDVLRQPGPRTSWNPGIADTYRAPRCRLTARLGRSRTPSQPTRLHQCG
ncbi:hypothetical protein SHIRM173S_00701 [Streptomyces hirsutus]